MRVCVHGLWHLGAVTAACLASAGHQVVALDENASAVAALNGGTPPLYEPGLAELLEAGLESNRLIFTTDASAALADCEVYWVTFDTPVDENDVPDVNFVLDRVKQSLPTLAPGCVVLVSSQLPVGSTRALARYAELSGFGTLTFTPLSQQEYLQFQLWTSLRTLATLVQSAFKEPIAGANEETARLLFPLWDPTISRALTPSLQDLQNVALGARQLTMLAEQLRELAEALIEHK